MQYTIDIPDDIAQKIQKMADESGKTFNGVVVSILLHSLKENGYLSRQTLINE